MKPPECTHEWSYWKTLYYPETTVGYAAIRTCTFCRWREFNDWTTSRIGNDFKLLPPEEQDV